MKAPPLSVARTVSELIFLSGQLGRDDNGAIVPGGIEPQAQQALANMARVLAEHGASLNDVVKVTVWLTDGAYAAAFNEVYASVFSKPYPARSMIVSALVAPGALVEVEAIAQRP